MSAELAIAEEDVRIGRTIIDTNGRETASFRSETVWNRRSAYRWGIVKTYENRESGSSPRRSHPWSTSTADPSHRYYDFRERPELIPVVLEDFRPWDGYVAIRSFYDLVAWINGPTSPFESNDSAFTGPEDNVDGEFRKKLQCGGRLGILFRKLHLNTQGNAVVRLIEGLHGRLRVLQPDFAWGAVGTTRLGVDFLELPDGGARGSQVLVSFWAWGDDEPEVFENLARVIAALRQALESPVG